MKDLQHKPFNLQSYLHRLQQAKSSAEVQSILAEAEQASAQHIASLGQGDTEKNVMNYLQELQECVTWLSKQ
ncbi:MAG: hypothetical protein ACOVQA_08800 [Thermoflexibacteraceae bacterium]|jgi:NADH:ubiquinone oxidoreductase subunit E